MRKEKIPDPSGTNGNAAVKLTVLCVLFYAVSYICRKSFDSNVNEIMDFYGQTKSAVAVIGTCFFIAYAVGQVVHGFLCKYYDPRLTVFVMALIVAVLNCAIGLLPERLFGYMKYLWLANGFASASFWSLIILTLNRNIAKRHMKMVMILTCFPPSLGTFFSYGISAVTSFLHNFRAAFLIASGVMLVTAAAWILLSGSLIRRSREEKDRLDEDAEEKTAAPAEQAKKPKSPLTRVFFFEFFVLALFAVINNLIKDGVNLWTPTILKELYGMENWQAVLLSVCVPLIAVLGGVLSIRINKLVRDHVINCGLLYFASALCLTVLILTLNSGVWALTLLLLVGTSLLMAAVNTVVTEIYPLTCEKGVNAGSVAGILDGFCYVGSAVSSYGIGRLVDATNSWNGVFVLFISLSAGAALVAAVSVAALKKMR